MWFFLFFFCQYKASSILAQKCLFYSQKGIVQGQILKERLWGTLKPLIYLGIFKIILETQANGIFKCIQTHTTFKYFKFIILKPLFHNNEKEPKYQWSNELVVIIFIQPAPFKVTNKEKKSRTTERWTKF